MNQLEVRGLLKRYDGGDRAAVDDVSFEIEKGSTLALVGPSGCGKSTTLRIIAGLESAQSGSVHLENEEITHRAPQERDIAMVFQGYALYPHMTIRDNIAFPLKMRGMKADERASRVKEVAKLLELERLLDRRPAELSGGERQRVAMGRAIVRRPKLFLFDEPLSNLDASLRSTLRVELGALLKDLEATAIFVTHDQTEAMTLGARIAIMNRGKIEQIGAPRVVYESPKTLFAATFIGSPQANMLPAESAAYAKLVPASMHRPGVAVFRPEQVTLSESEEGPGTVKSLEHLGAETIVHCDVEGTVIRARVLGFSSLRIGAHVSATIREIAHFDPKTGLPFEDEPHATA